MNLPALTNNNQSLIIILAIIGAVIVIAAIVLIIIFALRGKKGQKDNGGVWLLALGEKENIKEVTAIGSRLSVVLEDKEKIDRNKLKELGVSSVLVMSNKVTLVIEGKAEKIAELIKKDL